MAFRFKQFIVNDDRSSMKVGTDAVLLGSWASVAFPENILEVGTGCGLISLMLAQRFPEALITAIDIHRGSVAQAAENFRSSPWPDRLSVREISLQNLAGNPDTRFDMIVSNPPFFIGSLLPPDDSKKLAKHTGSLSHTELASATTTLLKPHGTLSLIFPFDNRAYFASHAATYGMHLSREMIICPVEGKAPNRLLTEWKKNASAPHSGSLTIRNKNNTYTGEYIEFTEGFYLGVERS